METLYFLKFWKPSSSTFTVPSPLVETHNEVEEEEEDDSFFDLELSTVPDFDNNKNNTTENKPYPDDKTTQESNRLVDTKQTTPKPNNSPKPTLSLSPSDPISKRKILPIEPFSKPQSPIALLKSAPKFGAFMFKKPKATATKKTEKTGQEAESNSKSNILMENQKLKKYDGEAPKPSKLTRENSSRTTGRRLQSQSSEDPKTERFSKDVLQKYLKLIKPLYLKVSKKYSEKGKASGDSPMASPASSPCKRVVSMYSPKKEKQGNIPAGIRVVCKHLGKSKSATSAIPVAPPVNRKDDSLLLHNDGIQSAILHCKRSFNSSRDSSSLSRSTSDSSSLNSYYSDSSLLPRFSSESHDKSARSSIEEGHGVEI